MTRRSMHGRRRPHPMVAAAVCIVLLVLGAFAVRHFVAQPFRVPSASLQPDLHPGDELLADRSPRGTAEAGANVVADGRGHYAPTPADGDRDGDERVIGV